MMADKLIFLMQVYFTISFLCTFILIYLRLPSEKYLWHKYRYSFKDMLAFLRNIFIMLIGFPIIAFYYGLKEF